MATAVKEDDLGVMSPLRIAYSDQVFTHLAESLNTIHQLNHSKRFWTLVTEEYVRAVMSRKEIMERNMFRGSPGLYPVIGQRIPGRLKKIKRGAGKLARHLKGCKNREKIHHALRKNDVFWAGFQGIPQFAETTGGAELPDQELSVFGMGNLHLRDRVTELANNTDNLFEKNTLLCIPKIFVEHFPKLYDSVKLIDPGSKTFHIMGKFRFGRRQLTIARYIDEGARLIWHQDGAFIGEVQHKYSRYLAHSVADKYRTWGWKLTDKDHPGPALFLEKFRHTYENADQTKTNDLLICFPKLSKAVRNRLLSGGETFFKYLDDSHYSAVRVRPQPSSTVSGQSERLKPLLTGTKAVLSDSRCPMAEEVASCRCVIQMSVPATNFLECIYMDHPTMGILNNDQPTDLIKPWYRFLEQNGVLYSSAERLVDQLNHMTIEEWWADLVESKGYQEFKHTFARNS